MTATPVLPLSGWRVLVPRPSAGRSPAEVALAAAGAEAVVVPLIETVPPEDPTELDDALLALESGWYAWLVRHQRGRGPGAGGPRAGERRQPDAAARRRPRARRRHRTRHRPGAARGRRRARPGPPRPVDLPRAGRGVAGARRAGPRAVPARRPGGGDGHRRAGQRGWEVTDVVAYRTVSRRRPPTTSARPGPTAPSAPPCSPRRAPSGSSPRAWGTPRPPP